MERRYAGGMLMAASARPLTCALLGTLALVGAACGRQEPDPPLIPLPTGATAAAPPLPLAPGPPAAPPVAVATAIPTAAQTTTTPVTTAGGAPPALTVPFTPFTIPIPPGFSMPPGLPPLPTVLPPLPTGIPGLPPFFPQPSPPDAGAPPPPAPTSSPAASDARVIEYGARWCGPCQQLKKDLTARAIAFVFVDVEDAKAMSTPAGRHAAEMPANMRKAVPATRVVHRDSSVEWVSGCDPDRIERGYR